MNRELIPQLPLLVERLTEWSGSIVEVEELLTRSPGNLNRHFTTRSMLLLRLDTVMIAISGGTLMILGKAFDREVSYSATVDQLERLSISSDEVVFVERFGSLVERYSTFRRLPEFGAAESGVVEDGADP